MESSKMSTFVFLCGLLQLFAFIVFLKGFLPMKITTSDFAKIDDTRFNLDQSCSNVSFDSDSRENRCFTPRVFDRMVFILIDALRADFVFGDINEGKEYRMKFVQKMLKSRQAVGFVSKAHPPTVTLPRIKAITTGTVPGFVDVINNIDTRRLAEDNIVSQLQRHGKKQVFYGDDTWLRLFPEHFSRSEGVVSFFIIDYKEVDDNVTRHLATELSHNDWDAMFLHYLGLDHIGHLAGPYSSLVGPKLKEMDGIVHTIYRKISEQDVVSGQSSLIVICGDHGISDLGSHGGSSPTEISTALLFISSTFKYNIDNFQEVEQIDIAATLSVLLGLPIPRNSLGVLILSALIPLDTEQRLRAVYNNAKQVTTVVKDSVDNLQKHPGYKKLQKVIDLHSDWLMRWRNESSAVERDKLTHAGEEILEMYVRSLKRMRHELVKHQSSYDLVAMASGIFIEACVCLFQLCSIRSYYIKSPDRLKPLSYPSVLKTGIVSCLTYFIVSLTVNGCNSFDAYSIYTPVAISLSAVLLVSQISLLRRTRGVLRSISQLLLKVFQGKPGTVVARLFLLFGSFLHIVSLMSSSFVEEEHQTWYFLTTSFLLILVICSALNIMDRGDQDNQKEPNDAVSINDINSKFDILSRGIESMTYSWKEFLLPVFVCLMLGRIARSMNQTGDKWSHLPDIGDWLIRPDNKPIHSLVNVLTPLTLCVLVWKRLRDIAWQALFTLGVIFVYCHQAAQGLVYLPVLYNSSAHTNGYMEAWLVYITILVMLIYSIASFLRSCSKVTKLVHHQISVGSTVNDHMPGRTGSRNATGISTINFSTGYFDIDLRISVMPDLWERVKMCFTLLMLLLTRSHNTPLVLIINVQSLCVMKTLNFLFNGGISVSAFTIISLWMGQAAFYYMGNSNSLATVDLAAGYKGISNYYLVPVSCLTFINTYSGSIYWILSLIQVLSTSFSTRSMFAEALKRSIHTILLTKSLISLPYFLLATLLRYHLFVWTVFSPKLLYEGLYTLVVSVVLCVVAMCCGVLMYVQKIIH